MGSFGSGWDPCESSCGEVKEPLISVTGEYCLAG